MSLTQITDYSIFDGGESKSLIQYFQEFDEFTGMLDVLNTQFEDLEAALFQLIEDLWLTTAVGVQLDILGEHLNLPREGRDDETYRSLLQLKAKVNAGAGTPEDLISAIVTLYGATVVNYIPDYPGKVIVEQNGTIGLFVLDDLETTPASGSVLVETTAASGADQIQVRQPDAGASTVLNAVIPAGVGLTVVQI